MNILLIDKELEFLDRLEKMVQVANNTPDLNIEKAHKPEDAAQLALQNGPDVVVIDPWFAPKWGLPLIKTLKDLRPNTCLILLCDCSGAKDPAHCKELSREYGADHHIQKKDLMSIPGIVRDLTRVGLSHKSEP